MVELAAVGLDCRKFGLELRVELDVLGADHPARGGDDVRDEVGQVHLGVIEHELSGLGLCEAQQVVDEPQQPWALRLISACALACFSVTGP